MTPMSSLNPARQGLMIAGVALVYFLSARLLISLSAVPAGPVTTVWFPSGMAVAALLLFGRPAAIGAFLGSMAVALHTHAPLPLALALSVGNTGSELLGWWLLAGRRGQRSSFSMEKVSDGPRLAAAALVAGLFSATVGVSSYVQSGLMPAQAFLSSWLVWLGSSVTSTILVAPVLVYWLRREERPWPGLARAPEYVSALALLVVAAFLWQGPVFQRGVNEPVVLLLIVGQLWVAFRFSVAAMTLSNAAIAVSSIFALVQRLGEAPPASAYPFILSLQLMLTGLAVTGYLLAAMVERQRRSTQALKEAQGAMVQGARDAGRAEIATNVLHNVGNVLNSVNVSAQLLARQLENSKVGGMSRAVDLIAANRDDLARYLSEDVKGKLLPGYLGQVAAAVELERSNLLQEARALVRSIDHIKEVVATQQSYAGVSTVLEPVRLHDLVEDALRLDRHALERTGVTVVREFQDVPVAHLDKARVVQILLNLISNARHAMAERAGARRLTLGIGREGGHLVVNVKDEGEGIAPDNLTRIFAHGFTTRQDGHGFGLHSSALASSEMGGKLAVLSAGLGHGATFTLQLPIGPETAA